ncbi:MAG: DUF262 domain-containing protein [Sulfurimonas sp.]|nr:DUF262 domain-containing protein [Sulfurimonas sp.]
MSSKYEVSQKEVSTLLEFIKSGEIAIPEIQRPFVWEKSKVRDLMDSLYQGYPVGYIIVWRNPNVKLKDGKMAEGKKVLIDGQQRITALTAAILGQQVVDDEYKRDRIVIAFNPLEGKFEVSNPAIKKDSKWISDIAPLLSGSLKASHVRREYCKSNDEVDEEFIEDVIDKLKDISKRQIGLIELAPDLDIETVTEIFIRINSQGVVLSQADFVMSKIAANEEYDGSTLRKAIDYFCHLAIAPEFYDFIKDNDTDFASTQYFHKMSWLRNINDDIYDPSYTDMLRVAFTFKFHRGKLADLVSLLSGRNFETRVYEAEIAKESFEKLKEGIFSFMSQTNFERFVMIIKSAGFVSSKQLRSQNVINFAYILYLTLIEKGHVAAKIESYVKRWLVMSILTGRYSGSPESTFDRDIKRIREIDFEEYIKGIEEGELSDAFWDVSLVQSLGYAASTNPQFNVFLASQAVVGDKGLFSEFVTVKDMLEHRGDVHHIFPRNYLKKAGLSRGKYNQVANYVYTQSEINIRIGDKAPKNYFAELFKQFDGGELKYGGIKDMDALKDNLKQNCIPEAIFDMELEDYDGFLVKRRQFIAQKIKEYYWKL